jgi:CheY-like chemotaxis protein
MERDGLKTPRGEGETVLVVEDDTAVRLLVTDLLAELGYRFLEAPGAPQAMTILWSSARIDLLLTDVGLPIITGRQLADLPVSRGPGSRCCSSQATPRTQRLATTFSAVAWTC